MVKCRLDSDEMCPVFFLSKEDGNTFGKSVEVSSLFLESYERNKEEFENFQKVLFEIYEKSKGPSGYGEKP